MQYSLFLLTALTIAQPELSAGDHRRSITVDDMKPGHWIHVPPMYGAK